MSGMSNTKRVTAVVEITKPACSREIRDALDAVLAAAPTIVTERPATRTPRTIETGDWSISADDLRASTLEVSLMCDEHGVHPADAVYLAALRVA